MILFDNWLNGHFLLRCDWSFLFLIYFLTLLWGRNNWLFYFFDYLFWLLTGNRNRRLLLIMVTYLNQWLTFLYYMVVPISIFIFIILQNNCARHFLFNFSFLIHLIWGITNFCIFILNYNIAFLNSLVFIAFIIVFIIY